jgi:glucose uptake protein GlcU
VVLVAAWGVFRLGEAASGREMTIRLAGSILVVGGAAVLAVAR